MAYDGGWGGEGIFLPPSFGGSDFNPAGSGFPFSLNMVAAGLRGLFTPAAPAPAPVRSQSTDDVDEQMIQEAIRRSMEDTGREPFALAGTSRQMMQSMREVQSGTTYRVEVVFGSDTKPENLKISRKDNVMTIDVKKDKQMEVGSDRVSCKEYTKKISLPENVDLNQLESSLSPEGVLIIEVPFLPKPEETMQPPSRSIQIPVIVEEEQ